MQGPCQMGSKVKEIIILERRRWQGSQLVLRSPANRTRAMRSDFRSPAMARPAQAVFRQGWWRWGWDRMGNVVHRKPLL